MSPGSRSTGRSPSCSATRATRWPSSAPASYRHEDYLKAVEEISAGRIRLAPLVSNRFPLEKYREAYEFIDANRETCMKVLIDLEDGKA